MVYRQSRQQQEPGETGGAKLVATGAGQAGLNQHKQTVDNDRCCPEGELGGGLRSDTGCKGVQGQRCCVLQSEL